MPLSILQWAGLPPPFGVTLLSLGLVFVLAPYLDGADFGFLRIPTLSPETRKRFRLIGPVALVVAIALHYPFLSTQPKVVGNRVASIPAASRPRPEPFHAGKPLVSLLDSTFSAVERSFKTLYTLEEAGITYSGMEGLRLTYIPGLEGRPNCPDDGQDGCIVGLSPLGEPGPSRYLPVKIMIYSNQGTFYNNTIDPRKFIASRLAPGQYDMSMSGDALDKLYIFGNVTVLPRQASLFIVDIKHR